MRYAIGIEYDGTSFSGWQLQKTARTIQGDLSKALSKFANEEIIPELLQSKCNAKNIYKLVNEFLDTPSKMKEQVVKTQNILNKFKTDKSSSELASLALNKFL